MPFLVGWVVLHTSDIITKTDVKHELEDGYTSRIDSRFNPLIGADTLFTGTSHLMVLKWCWSCGGGIVLCEFEYLSFLYYYLKLKVRDVCYISLSSRYLISNIRVLSETLGNKNFCCSKQKIFYWCVFKTLV